MGSVYNILFLSKEDRIKFFASLQDIINCFLDSNKYKVQHGRNNLESILKENTNFEGVSKQSHVYNAM